MIPVINNGRVSSKYFFIFSGNQFFRGIIKKNLGFFFNFKRLALKENTE